MAMTGVRLNKTAGKAAQPKTGRPKTGRPVTGRTVLVWLGGFFLVIFAANAVFIWLAIGSFPGVVVESSYEAGLAYNREIASAKAQEDLGWTVDAHVEQRSDGTADLQITARDEAGNPLGGLAFTASFIRPAGIEPLHRVTLGEAEVGRYVGIAEGLAAGQWDLDIQAENDEGVAFRSRNRLFIKE